MTHEFDESATVGELGAKDIEEQFSRFWNIKRNPTAGLADRAGIDAVWTHKNAPISIRVEYKTDERAEGCPEKNIPGTGNAFVEVISVDADGKPGWAITCKADVLLYYLPRSKQVCWWYVSTLKRKVPIWLSQPGRYPIRQAQNDGYMTHGICIPLREFKESSEWVSRLEGFSSDAGLGGVSDKFLFS